jgi:very-short-patch-repair endonuclease
MEYQRHQEFWRVVRRQHGVISRDQLMALGYSGQAIKRRLASGRLYVVYRGVYVVGRPELGPLGLWMAAVLSCGPDAVLSDSSAAALLRIGDELAGTIEITIPPGTTRRRPNITVHRRPLAPADRTEIDAIPVTTPTRTLVDLATRLPPPALERAVNEADKRDLVTADALREALSDYAGQPGSPALRALLDHRTFRLTDSELERRFLPIAAQAGLPPPQTGARLNGFKVDFYWPTLGLVVETDGLRYHRTPAQQARDQLRDQAHTAAGLTTLRFTHEQVRYEPAHVRRTLAAVAAQAFTPRGRNKPR